MSYHGDWIAKRMSGLGIQDMSDALEQIIKLRSEVERLNQRLSTTEEVAHLWMREHAIVSAEVGLLREDVGQENRRWKHTLVRLSRAETEIERLNQEVETEYKRCGCEVDPNSEAGEPYAWCLYHRALKAERDQIIEQCAEVCDTEAISGWDSGYECAHACAAAIRALKG
jgi:hypothetical protein